MDNTTRQATTNKQAEILFKFTVGSFSVDVVFMRRTPLEILKSLKLMNIKQKNRMIKRNITASVQEIIMSSAEITYKVVCTMSNTARRVSSLRLVTDVR